MKPPSIEHWLRSDCRERATSVSRAARSSSVCHERPMESPGTMPAPRPPLKERPPDIPVDSPQASPPPRERETWLDRETARPSDHPSATEIDDDSESASPQLSVCDVLFDFDVPLAPLRESALPTLSAWDCPTDCDVPLLPLRDVAVPTVSEEPTVSARPHDSELVAALDPPALVDWLVPEVVELAMPDDVP